jgi:hypothetical protein
MHCKRKYHVKIIETLRQIKLKYLCSHESKGVEGDEKTHSNAHHKHGSGGQQDCGEESQKTDVSPPLSPGAHRET